MRAVRYARPCDTSCSTVDGVAIIPKEVKKKRKREKKKKRASRERQTRRSNSHASGLTHGGFVRLGPAAERFAGNSTKPRISVKPSGRGPGAMVRAIERHDGYGRLSEGRRLLLLLLLLVAAAARSGDRSTRHHMVCRDLRAHKRDARLT